MSSQQIAQGRSNLKKYSISLLKMCSGKGPLQLTVQCEGHSAGALRQITTVGGPGNTGNYTGLTRGFGVSTLIELAATVGMQSSGRLPQTVKVDLRIQWEQTFVKIKGVYLAVVDRISKQ